MPGEIINSGCIEFLRETEDHWQCIFADPPDNLGLKYDGYSDVMDEENYFRFTASWMYWASRCCDWLWVSFNPRHILMFSRCAESILQRGERELKPCVQVFTFGNYQHKDLSNNHRMLWRIGLKGAKLYPEHIKVPSWRQLNGDKRAAEGGRVPGDVFDFARVTGNSKQRRIWHPTQLHEGLVERCIKLCTTEGDSVLDIFGGTGTTARVCERIGRNWTLVEQSEEYCEKIREEMGERNNRNSS